MSDNEHITVRIVDIARMAGVSVATVDRVIHNRGKVSEENLARINEVLRRVDYRPNLIARSLASGRRYTLCAVMPRFAPGEYWADFEAGIARAEAEAVRYNVTVRRFCFDQYDRSSFESLLETLRDRHSARVYTQEDLTLEQLSFLLWATQGIKQLRGKSYATLRTVPSGGAQRSASPQPSMRRP